MRALLAVWFFLCALSAPTHAAAELADPPIVMRDPGVYAQTFADAMALGGVQPLREVFAQIIGPENAFPSQLDASLRIYEQPDMIKPAVVSRVVDDLMLTDTFRIVYLYHYYGGNFWIFTRLEFVRIGNNNWTLMRVAFADQWANVVLTTTPGFQSATRPANRRE